MRAGDNRDKLIKFRFGDTMGLEEGGGLEVSNIEKIMEGRVRDQTEVEKNLHNPYQILLFVFAANRRKDTS